jgi:ubiquinone/menaquinone biosynthesis C-methylase UbiE
MAASRPPNEPEDARRFTREWDRAYTAFARSYDRAVRWLPVWKTWLRRALPHVEGPRVLEVAFGTGYLISQYAGRFQTFGLDYNRTMIDVARANLRRAGASASLVRGDVGALPWPDGVFDTVVNTMAFSGFPDGARAMAEMKRVLRPGGRLVLVDVTFPPDGNRMGTAFARLWERSGDVLRDLPALFRAAGLAYTDEPVGARGGVRLYVATRPA